ncbi:hypothetical protein N781_13090 [Pontibacillus halophilus JSM 076056 = DSM 19796]|uniref:SCP2 domain-containing protein n=1 Tax=Pontibacillus halophilus JSM 076056 = DSM 19796 TaxID=1385510 RepID=A0A0A5GIH5_9BACI|nr:hypothetical protein [Pontibacillus halophilus]KGX93036.1 hypothetical protein N781_13090 [Pontibacillus halophilus JSM 076056 = DSM 19796]
MLLQQVQHWKERVMSRQDLAQFYETRPFSVHLRAEGEDVWIKLHHSTIVISTTKLASDVELESSTPIFSKLVLGEQALYRIPKHLIKKKGPYRHLLALESLFYLPCE